MNSIIFMFVVSLVSCFVLVNADDDGKYHSSKYNQAGKYVPTNDRAYHHVDDQRHLGRYIHIPYPYMGGYGPFSNPYEHIDSPYIHSGQGVDYEHVSSSSEYHPFNAQGYDIEKPEISLVYGAFLPLSQLQSSPNYYPESSPTETNPFDTPTTTDASIYDNDSTTILTGDSLKNRKKRSLFHSQPKTIEIRTTTSRPRTRYDDEGKWRIIQQEENKEEKKYDYFFETENKIFAQEAGKVSRNEKSNEGTSGIGWYQYIGDDGKVYRVEYESGVLGFIPKGDHIHKAIQKHLNNLKERNSI